MQINFARERTPGNVAPKRPTLQSSASHAKDSRGKKQEERIVAATVVERTELKRCTARSVVLASLFLKRQVLSTASDANFV